MYSDFDCWNKKYSLFFLLPQYIENYDVKKITLPTIRWDEKNNEPVFTFALYENFMYQLEMKNKSEKRIVAAYDLGRKKAFCLSIVNYRGGVIAEYEPSVRLRDLNDKRERLIQEKKDIYKKIDAYEALGAHAGKAGVLRREVEFMTARIKALGKQVALLMGHEIAELCVKHRVDIVACEDLSWVNEKAGRSSRWNHSKQQDAVGHACKRRGVKQVRGSAAFTSKSCCECGSRNVSVSSSSRIISCGDCGASVDRDVSSARFQARRKARVLERARWRELLRVQREQALLVSDFSWFPARGGVGAGLAVVPFLNGAGLGAWGSDRSDRISHHVNTVNQPSINTN